MSGVVRAVCVTRSVALRRALRRSLHAAGAAVEFVDDVGGVGADATLVVIDGPTHAALAAPARAALASRRAMIVVGVSLGDDGAVDGLRADGQPRSPATTSPTTPSWWSPPASWPRATSSASRSTWRGGCA
jgi:hypothetical protein